MKRFAIYSAVILSALFLAMNLQARDIVYTDASQFPLFGKAAPTEAHWQRLPARLKGVSRDRLVFLGTNSCGLYVRFRSNSSNINVRWTSLYSYWMPHMAPTGTRGLDLYILTDDGWKFAGSGRPDRENATTTADVVCNMEPQMREYMLYLSLYDGIESMEIGIDPDAVIEAPKVDSPRSASPIVMYGTSIMQGGCCSRPGMAFVNILGRRFDRTCVDLGFSGNAFIDMEIAEIMAQVPDPAVYVLDWVPNANAEAINARGEQFFNVLRQAHPDVPVVFVEDPIFDHSRFDKRMLKEITDKNVAQKALFASLKKKGVKKIYYLPAEKLLPPDGEGTVDGIHPTDYGMVHYADAYASVLKKLIK